MIDKTLKRTFIDLFKKEFNLNEYIEFYTKEYLQNINNSFKLMHNLQNKWDSSSKLFSFKIRHSCFNENNDDILHIFNNRNEIRKYQWIISKLYYKQFDIFFDYGYGNWNIIINDCSKYELNNIIKNLLNNMIIYIYKNIANEIYNIFNISKNDYMIKFGKIYNNEYDKYNLYGFDNFDLNYYICKYLPFISYNTDHLMNIITGDIINQDLIYTLYYTMLFPTKKILISKNNYYDQKYDLLTTNHKCLFVNNNIYIPNLISIGNISNHLCINIINKKNNSSFIISYNNIGAKPKIIQNISSIHWISIYNKNNKKEIISKELFDKYTNNEISINEILVQLKENMISKINNLNNLVFKLLQNIIKEEYNTNNAYNTKIIPDKINVSDLIPIFIINFKENMKWRSINDIFKVIKDKIIIKDHNLINVELSFINEYIHINQFCDFMDYNEYIKFINNNSEFLPYQSQYRMTVMMELKDGQLEEKNKVLKNLFDAFYYDKRLIKLNLNDLLNNLINREQFYKIIYPEKNKYNIFDKEIEKYSHIIALCYYYSFIKDFYNNFYNDLMNINDNQSNIDTLIQLHNTNEKCKKKIIIEKKNYYNNIDFSKLCNDTDILNTLMEINYYNDKIKLNYENIMDIKGDKDVQ